MKHFNLYATIILSLLITTISAQNQPSFIIKNGIDDYELHLDIKNENIDTVFINGFYSAKGDNQNFSCNLTAKELFRKKKPNTKIHNLDKNVDYAFYSITVKDKEGELNYYPSVKINMPFSNIIVKL